MIAVRERAGNPFLLVAPLQVAPLQRAITN
jgi:hypothetical protein